MGSNQLLRAPELLLVCKDTDHSVFQADQHLVAVLEAEGPPKFGRDYDSPAGADMSCISWHGFGFLTFVCPIAIISRDLADWRCLLSTGANRVSANA
jgi:hypothetical protein